MDTAHAHPDDPQPLGASLRRSSGDRILLGLCAGIARSTNISPLAMRLGTVLVSFILLPFVLLAYTVTAVLVPRDDGAALIGTGWRDRRDVWIALGLTLLAAPVALGAGSAGGPALWTGHFGFVLLPLMGLAALAFIAMRRDRAAWSPASPAPTPTPTPTTPAAAYTVADATAVTSATAPVDAPAATDEQSEGPVPDAPGASDGLTTERPAGDGPGFASPPPPPQGPTFVRSGSAQPPEPAPRRPGLTLMVLAAVVAVPAFFGLLLAAGAVDAKPTSWAVMLAVMAVVSAAGAVAIAVLRPSYLGPGLLVLLAAALGISSIAVGQFGKVFEDGVGERDYRVSTRADLATPFVLGAGEMNIDLRPLHVAPNTRYTVHARIGFGEINVAIPRGVRVLTTPQSNASALTTTARENGATDSESATAPTIVLDLRARGANARLVTGQSRDVSQLDVMAETSIGFWNGRRSNGPFAPGLIHRGTTG